MAPQGKQNFQDMATKTRAAVLILLYPVKNEPWTIFIKRPEYKGAHSGQVGLPGGKIESSDENLEFTALRETSEELGIQKQIIIIGSLSSLVISVSNFEVYPFAGYLKNKPDWKPNSGEVKYVIEAPIAALLNPVSQKTEKWNMHGTEIDVPFYHIKNEKIWGATAMIISEFLEIIKV